MLRISNQSDVNHTAQASLIPCSSRIVCDFGYDRHAATLCSASSKKGGTSIFYFFGTIWSAIVRFLSNWSLFKTCFKETLDWEETRTTFMELKEAVYPPSQSEADPKKCQRQFDEKYQQLSFKAKELFRKHVAYGIAREQGKKDRAAQEQYVKQNWTLIVPLIDRALSEITRTAIREAIVSFEVETSDK